MTLGNMRSLGVRSIAFWCRACGWSGSTVVDDLPGEMAVPATAVVLACPDCGARDGEVMPEWREYRAQGAWSSG